MLSFIQIAEFVDHHCLWTKAISISEDYSKTAIVGWLWPGFPRTPRKRKHHSFQKFQKSPDHSQKYSLKIIIYSLVTRNDCIIYGKLWVTI